MYMPTPSPALKKILLPVYGPCPAFNSSCKLMRWSPYNGHVPRGFCGCTGSCEEVRLVLIVAEPGDPHPEENHSVKAGSEELFEETFCYSYRCYREGKDQFHRNVRHILNLCWPDLSFDEQMRKTWITESVLCSASKQCGSVPSQVWRECTRRYLLPQIALFRRAIIAALGSKARDRTLGIIPGVCTVKAAAPPGCNHRGARQSWQELAGSVRLLNERGSSQAPGPHIIKENLIHSGWDPGLLHP